MQTADYAIGKTVEKGRHLNESYISGWQCTGEFLFYFVELIQMGHYYNEMDLVKRAERQLILFIDEENALKIYDDLALKFDLEVCFLSFHFLGLTINRKFPPSVIVSTQRIQKHVLELLYSTADEVIASSEFNQMSEEGKYNFLKRLTKEYQIVCAKRPRAD